jgi:threonine efflux protein
MSPVWINLCSFLGVFILVIISPGPNFILVVNRSMTGPLANGLWTALGVAVGSGFYGLCGLLGWIEVLDSFKYFGLLVRLAGGGYLVCLGLQMLVRYCRLRHRPAVIAAGAERSPNRPFSLLASGLATNLSNPKAWVFYLSLFSVVLAPGVPLWAKIFLDISLFLISLSWYSLVAVLISRQRRQPFFLSRQLAVQGLLGSVLIVLGLRLFIR